jgi:hypothetical protein
MSWACDALLFVLLCTVLFNGTRYISIAEKRGVEHDLDASEAGARRFSPDPGSP